MKQGIFNSIVDVVDFMMMLEFSAQVRYILRDHGYWTYPTEMDRFVSKLDCTDIGTNPHFKKVIVNCLIIAEKHARVIHNRQPT